MEVRTLTKYVIMHGTFYALDDNALMHIAVPKADTVKKVAGTMKRQNVKYVKREKVNGKWVYTYPEDLKKKQQTVQKTDSAVKSTQKALLDERSKPGGGDRLQVLVKQNKAAKAQQTASTNKIKAVEAVRKTTDKGKEILNASLAAFSKLTDKSGNKTVDKTDKQKTDTPETDKTTETPKETPVETTEQATKQEVDKSTAKEKSSSSGGSGKGSGGGSSSSSSKSEEESEKKEEDMTAQQRYEKAKADLDAAQKNLEEVRKLHESGNANDAQLEAAQKRVDEAQKALDEASKNYSSDSESDEASSSSSTNTAEKTSAENAAKAKKASSSKSKSNKEKATAIVNKVSNQAVSNVKASAATANKILAALTKKKK